MRILLVSEAVPYLPCHDGFRNVLASLIRELSSRHEVHLIAISHGGESAEEAGWPRKYCCSYATVVQPAGLSAKVRALAGICDPVLGRMVNDATEAVKPEVIHAEGAGLAALFRDLPPAPPQLLCIHDSKSLRYREFARYSVGTRDRIKLKALFFLARWHERRWFRYAGRVVVISAADAGALANVVAAERLSIIPAGVDLDYFAYRPAPDPGRIVFTGNMSWPPNRDAAEHFAVEVLPRIRASVPDVSFWIVGAQPSGRLQRLERMPGVHVTGTVADLRPWLWSAAVYASPIRFGLGAKIKILEAMASGAPIVATSRSLSGAPLIHGRHALIADDDREIAEAVIRLLGDSSLRQALSLEARKKVEAEYAWPSIAARFEQLYLEMCGRGIA